MGKYEKLPKAEKYALSMGTNDFFSWCAGKKFERGVQTFAASLTPFGVSFAAL